MEQVFSRLAVSISAVDPAKPSRNAFIFITTEPDCCRTAFEDLKKLEHVQEVYLSHGAYDIIAKVNGESLDYLREVVLKQIKNLTSIKSTLTLTLI